MQQRALLKLGAVLAGVVAAIGGCNDTSNGLRSGDRNGALDPFEQREINSYRNQSFFSFNPQGGRSDLVLSAQLTESAIRHTGYLQSVTDEETQAVDPGVETDATLPLYTGGGPEARAAAAGHVTPEVDEVYISKPLVNGSRVSTAWYSRKGRLPMIRNATTEYGFGSVQQARELDGRVPAEGTNVQTPTNDPFWFGNIHGTFAFFTDPAVAATALKRGSFWPSSTVEVSPTTVWVGEGTHCLFGTAGGALTLGSDFPAHATDPETGGAFFGMPIHFALETGSIGFVRVFELYYRPPSATSGVWAQASPAVPFEVWTSPPVRGMPGETPGAFLHHDIHTLDGDYLNSEIFFVPSQRLRAGYYKLVVGFNAVGANLNWTTYFQVIRERLR